MSIEIKIPPAIDFTKPKAIVNEIFEDDKWIKDAFSSHFSAELLEFAEILAEGFKGFNKLDKLASKDEQCLYTAAFIHGVFDDLVTSTKLLTSGKMIASGNLMRQAIEGV